MGMVSNKIEVMLLTKKGEKVYWELWLDNEISTELTEDKSLFSASSVEEFAERIKNTLADYPYLVAEKDGEILGYVYASTFKPRCAYRHCVETSIYVAREAHGQGVGSKLYEALEEELKSRGIINLNACIAWIETPNSHLTHQSPDFHSKMGYKRVAHFHRCGYKFDEWYDMIWMEKLLDVKYFK
jgi:phosphinothricin acetyltransferase